MARKPSSYHQPLLEFSPDTGETPVPQVHVQPDTKGNDHAVQNDNFGAPTGTPTDLRPTPPESDAARDAGTIRNGVENQSPRLAGSPLAGEAGQRPEPD